MTLHTDLMLLRSPHLTFPHAFSTRAGGVSSGPYAGLNLDDREDDAHSVAENRRRLTTQLGFTPARVASLTQVHGADVAVASAPGVHSGDAIVTAQPDLLLAIMTADCYPLLLEDAEAGVIGAAHAGWRGTVARIGARTIEAMTRLGARPERIRAAVGPGICGARYAVGEDVAAQFRAAGLGDALSGLQLDLARANTQVLVDAGVSASHLWVSGRCTTEPDFYSYRRDAGRTGRMWALIGRGGAEPHGVRRAPDPKMVGALDTHTSAGEGRA
ncbi:peptidoglycan editing factor PgeF [Deinococcus maricopensis]|uniref:Purine nucleoside phosphorylase n=1 Tax=Deinococcus maricopensis (strain DSM 21211 / LMG 22137 / NRRL B-23946 / LB-34) TaxID=709986 RepID=E8U3Z4_DEIML|nr:peptidoglycan editing factor PgeF [Deinococcus maricopensis]ADV65688.1 Multi-copper polyphenol oxidoreductase, laccase [Deinococcus maricopensis DSM 21211]